MTTVWVNAGGGGPHAKRAAKRTKGGAMTRKKGAIYQGRSGQLDVVALGEARYFFRGGAFSHALTVDRRPVNVLPSDIATAAMALPDRPGVTSNMMLADKSAHYVPKGIEWRTAKLTDTTPMIPSAAVRRRAVYLGQRDAGGVIELAFSDPQDGGVYLQKCETCTQRKAPSRKRKK